MEMWNLETPSMIADGHKRENSPLETWLEFGDRMKTQILKKTMKFMKVIDFQTKYSISGLMFWNEAVLYFGTVEYTHGVKIFKKKI